MNSGWLLSEEDHVCYEAVAPAAVPTPMIIYVEQTELNGLGKAKEGRLRKGWQLSGGSRRVRQWGWECT